AGEVAIDAWRRLAHLAVGEHDAGRIELRNLLGLDHHAAIALRHEGRRAEVSRFGFLVPFEAIGMANEAADGEVLQAARTVPGALVVGVEDVALGIEANAAGRTHAAGGRDEFAIGGDLAAPAAEL